MKDRLKLLRKSLGFKQREIAARLGVSTGSIGGWESGSDVPGAARIFQICKVFNVSEKWLREGVGEMFNAPVKETDAEITRRHILDLYDQMPPGLQAEFLKICQEVVEKVKEAQAQEEHGGGATKTITLGDNNRNINITQ